MGRGVSIFPGKGDGLTRRVTELAVIPDVSPRQSRAAGVGRNVQVRESWVPPAPREGGVDTACRISLWTGSSVAERVAGLAMPASMFQHGNMEKTQHRGSDPLQRPEWPEWDTHTGVIVQSCRLRP